MLMLTTLHSVYYISLQKFSPKSLSFLFVRECNVGKLGISDFSFGLGCVLKYECANASFYEHRRLGS